MCDGVKSRRFSSLPSITALVLTQRSTYPFERDHMRLPISRLVFHVLLIAIAIAMIPSPSAHAGTYVMTSHSGGTYTNNWQGSVSSGSYSWTNTGCSVYLFDNGGGSGSASGALTATYTWQPAYPGDAPPVNVIITQTCDASAGWYNNGQTNSRFPPSCSADNGLGGTLTTSGQPPVSGSVDSKSTKYSIVAGQNTITIPTCSPTAKASGPACAVVSIVYTFSVSPVTVTVGGTTRDSNGVPSAQIGEAMSSSISTAPLTPSTWSWTISGTTFQSWSTSQGPPMTGGPVVSGPGATNKSTAAWYWNDGGGVPSAMTTDTVSCTVTGKFPDGTSGTVSGSENVNVYVPAWTSSNLGGTMHVDVNGPGMGGGYALYAGPVPASGEIAGMAWTANTNPPIAAFAHGTLEIVQLVTPGRAESISDILSGLTTNYVNSTNGIIGIDSGYPYANVSGDPISTNDNPGMGLGGSGSTVVSSATMADQFIDYLMFEPAGSGQYVPIGSFHWSTNGNAQIPSTFNWADYSGSPGTVNPSGPSTFTSDSTWPVWTQNSGNGAGHWIAQ